MTRGQNELLVYFMEQLCDHLASAGCNDMDQSVFKKMSPARVEQLKIDFERWDKEANPDGYEGPTKFGNISDSGWVHFLLDQIKQEIV